MGSRGTLGSWRAFWGHGVVQREWIEKPPKVSSSFWFCLEMFQITWLVLRVQFQCGRPAERDEKLGLTEGDKRETGYRDDYWGGRLAQERALKSFKSRHGTVIPGCGDQGHAENENTATYCDVQACRGWDGWGLAVSTLDRWVQLDWADPLKCSWSHQPQQIRDPG